MTYSYEWPMIPDTTTVVLVDVSEYEFDSDDARICLGKRRKESSAFPGYWGLPGGFIDVKDFERAIDCVQRETQEETLLMIEKHRFDLLGVDDVPGVDPRYQQIRNICYIVTVTPEERNIARAADDLDSEAGLIWPKISDALNMDLAFRHHRILEWALERL